VFPDTGRLERTRRAFDELRAAPPSVVRGDAVETIGAVEGPSPMTRARS
jgi:hypothetical protein